MKVKRFIPTNRNEPEPHNSRIDSPSWCQLSVEFSLVYLTNYYTILHQLGITMRRLRCCQFHPLEVEHL
jgi:hypothetical protein